MSLAEDLQILVQRGAYYGLDGDVLKEFPHFFHDILFGASLSQKDPSCLYADLHAHIPQTVSMTRLLTDVSQRVDICSIVAREEKYRKGYLDFERAVEKLHAEGIALEMVDERFAKVMVSGKPFYLLRAIEVSGKENQELVIVGNDREFRENRVNETPLDDLIFEAKDLGALWFLDHPFSIEVPVLSFRYPTKEEERRLRGWIEKHQPLVETGNHQNTLWMYPANVAMRRLAREYGLPEITNSDSHFRIQEIGLSRTSFLRGMIDDRSGDAFLASLQEAFFHHKGLIRLESGYSSIWAFSQYMIFPTLLWKLGMNKAARRLRGIEN